MKISSLMPTRNRPENLRRIFQSALDTVDRLDLFEFSLCVDHDDSSWIEPVRVFKERLNIRVAINNTVPVSNYGEIWNAAWRNATGEIYQMIGDDFIYRTKGWDTRIRNEFERFPDRILFILGEDGFQHGCIGTHGFVHKNWTDALGYYAPMNFKVYCHDHWLDNISRLIGRRLYIPELFFEHMHHLAKKAPMDDTYKRMLGTGYEKDLEIWQNTETIREDEAKKLKGVLK